MPTRNIPPKLRKALIEEAGGKCSNPGCASSLVEIHHIEKWHIVKCHDEVDMVAICPTCHAAVHSSHMKITDEQVRRWKALQRQSAIRRGHFYVEHGKSLKIMLGTLGFTTLGEHMSVFDLGNENILSFRISDGSYMKLNARIQDASGREMLRVVENDIVVREDESITFQQYPGRAVITVPNCPNYVPPWLPSKLASWVPDFITEGRALALDLEVMEPGVVRAKGFWCGSDVAFVADEARLYISGKYRHTNYIVNGTIEVVGKLSKEGAIFSVR